MQKTRDGLITLHCQRGYFTGSVIGYFLYRDMRGNYFSKVMTVISEGQLIRTGRVQPMPELTYSDWLPQ